MALTQYEIQPLFATPYFRADISHAISEEQINFIKNLKMNQNQTNLISEELYLFKLPQLKSIDDAIQEALDIYAKEVMGIKQRLRVTQSWALTNQPGAGMHSHSHSNSIISGSLYYCDMPEPVSRVFFDKHTMYKQLEIRPEQDKQNLYNTYVNVITPRKSEVILFPSDLNHMVEANGSRQPRHSIAFNSFVRGKVGDYKDVSELEL